MVLIQVILLEIAACFFCGMFLAELVTGRPKGVLSALTRYPSQKLPSVFIGLGHSKIERAYHIHHWMWSKVLVVVFALIGEPLLAALSAGICVQGLTYGDRFMIRVKMDNEE